jgi:glycosyltransferase involved in cell wall biosynthesis
MRRLVDAGEAARREMGAEARTFVREAFDIEVVAERWLALYGELLDRARAG